jgi:hypothetical protein
MAKIQNGSNNTIPGQDDSSSDVTFETSSQYAGGVTSYVPPSSSVFGNPNQPYLWQNDDWQLLLYTPRDQVTNIQALLVKAFPGFRPGIVGDKTDSRTIAQFKKALARANQMQADPNSPLRGADIQKTLAYLAENPAAATKTYRNTVSVRLTNPDDLKIVFQKASQQTLGRSLSDQELAKLAESYNSLEKSYQYKAVSGGTTTAPPDVTTYGIEQAKKAAPMEAKAVEYTNYIDALSKMMGG